MVDDSAIKEIQSGTVMQKVQNHLENGARPAVVLHKDYGLHSIEHLLPNPARFRGRLSTSHLESFSNYVKEENIAEQSACFINPDDMVARVIMDLGTNEAPGHRDHTAALSMEKTPEYQALCNIDGDRQGQKAMAEWLEDWAHCLDFTRNDADDKDTVINQKKVITAVRNITIEQAARAQHETEQLSERRSTMQSIEASSSTGDMPDTIMFTCTPYEGLDKRVFHLRLSITTGDKLGLTLRIKNHEAHRHEMAENFEDVVTEALEEARDLRIFIGEFRGG